VLVIIGVLVWRPRTPEVVACSTRLESGDEAGCARLDVTPAYAALGSDVLVFIGVLVWRPRACIRWVPH
jgi:hypothetical protein